MRILPTTLILLMGIGSVFAQASLAWPQRLLDTQVDLLPALMVVTALRLGLPSVVLLALVGGMAFDSLSLNRLGATTLPLGLVGVALHVRREQILRETPFAQACLGAMAGVAVPLGSLLLILTAGDAPLLGPGLVWNLIVLGTLNGLATPVTYKSPQHTSFRPDREIRRGRF